MRVLRRVALLALLGGLVGGPADVAAAEIEALSFPPLTGRVVDGAGMLSVAARETLTRELAAHEAATGQQVVVVTLPTLDGRAIEDYGYQLGRRWGIGRKEHDDGALLIVAQAERQIRIEVGYGLEGTLTDAASWDIIQSHMVPHFRQGDYEGGIVAGTRALLAVLGGSPLAPDGAQGSAEEREPLDALFFWIVVVIIVLNAFGGGRRRGRLAGGVLPGFVLGGLRGFPHGGGLGGGGFGGGGFGGRGGGFGGGGASGGW